MNQLGLFAKFWQPGSVKTRLAKSIGDQAACQIYRCFVNHLLSRHQLTGDSRCVVFSPPEKRREFREAVSQDWDVVEQSDGDLGQRMRSYFEIAFDLLPGQSSSDSVNEIAKVAIIGADSPLLDSAVVATAFDCLDQVPVVIIPSRDGGYCLIAMRRPEGEFPDLFSGIDWSTPSVLDQTIARLEQQQIEFRLLKPFSDVDEIEDLIELKSNLESRSRDDWDESLLKEVNLALSATGKPTELKQTDPSPEE